MDAFARAQHWLRQVSNESLYHELEDLLNRGDNSEIEDAFFQDLSFGTAGLRGIVGPGTNRMNIYTVGRATQGFADYIVDHCKEGTPKLAVARDSRHMGSQFVEHAASVLAAHGIEVYIFPRVEPTPLLSFAVRKLGACAGICMTASHNPARYNGYKAYGADGCQITSAAAAEISSRIASIDSFTGVETIGFATACEEGLIHWIEDSLIDEYIDAVYGLRLAPEIPMQDLSVVYTPLCGTGLECMEKLFEKLGVKTLTYVEEQAQPNGDFPTCEYPNPEEEKALSLGLGYAKAHSADLLLATDPDADRVGIAVRRGGDYYLPTGNEVGIILFDYICKQRFDYIRANKNSCVISTIVSSSMIDAIANDYGVSVVRTLTGFKYIGDHITQLELDGKEHEFLFGFEESYGYLSGSHVRDKDAINACLLICEAAAYYKQQGMTLHDALLGLYRKYGHYANRTINIAFPGAEGAAAMEKAMEDLRVNTPRNMGSYRVVGSIDYAPGEGNLPPANVVELLLPHNEKLIFRPSGTEPKMKVYCFTVAETAELAKVQLDQLEETARAYLGDS